MAMVSVWSLVAASPAERRSVSGREMQSEMSTELASELQWLREKTAQVFRRRLFTYLLQ